VAIGTPYITPAMLINAPTGVSWNIIPEPGALQAAQTAEQTAICWRATSIVDTYCNQVLRATVDTEYLTGPGAPRVSVQDGTSNGLLVMRRWPVTQVLAILTSSNRVFPRTWAQVPAGQFEVVHPLINTLTDTASATAPDGGSSIAVACGYIPPLNRCGRNSTRVQVSYVNGWPHTSLTANAAQGASVLQVDDVTGWAGASGFAYDGSVTETVSVLSVAATSPVQLPNGAGTAQAGPGTVTLSSPLVNAHAAGVVVSAIPANVLWATVLAATTQALESGITAIAIQNLPGSETVGGHGVSDLQVEYELLLDPFRRVI
jgi:hypothetical protein